MQSLGNGYAGIKKINILINIQKPMTVSNYNKALSKIINVAKIIAEETINDVAKEIHENSLSADDDCELAVI